MTVQGAHISPEWGTARRREITFYPPGAAREEMAGRTGREYLQAMIDGRIPPPPIAELAASRLVSVGDGECVFRCKPDESWLNPLGLVHGGLLCTLMDTAIGVAVQTTQPVGRGFVTIELKVSYLKPVAHDGSELEARGRLLRAGRRIAFAEGHVYDAKGTLVGHATSSLAAVDA